MFENSRWFFDEFEKIFSENGTHRDLAVSCYSSSPAFTAFITERINNIIRSRNYIAMNEYFRIDVMGYTSKREQLDTIKELEPQLWDLEVAVEHENAHEKWLDEVIKLAHVCCPLRVIIGYVPASDRYHGDTERLEYASKALSMLKCRDNMKNGEFMIILGSSKTKSKDEFFNYKAYVLNPETFVFESL